MPPPLVQAEPMPVMNIVSFLIPGFDQTGDRDFSHVRVLWVQLYIILMTFFCRVEFFKCGDLCGNFYTGFFSLALLEVSIVAFSSAVR